MRWRRERPDPISDEAKQARQRADQQAQHADTIHAEAQDQLRASLTAAAKLSAIRQRNHFAEAFSIVLGGHQ